MTLSDQTSLAQFAVGIIKTYKYILRKYILWPYSVPSFKLILLSFVLLSIRDTIHISSTLGSPKALYLILQLLLSASLQLWTNLPLLKFLIYSFQLPTKLSEGWRCFLFKTLPRDLTRLIWQTLGIQNMPLKIIQCKISHTYIYMCVYIWRISHSK